MLIALWGADRNNRTKLQSVGAPTQTLESEFSPLNRSELTLRGAGFLHLPPDISGSCLSSASLQTRPLLLRCLLNSLLSLALCPEWTIAIGVAGGHVVAAAVFLEAQQSMQAKKGFRRSSQPVELCNTESTSVCCN